MSASPPVATKEKLFEEFNAVVAETETLLKSVATAGSDQAGALKASVAKGLADAGARLARIRDESVGQAGAAVHATDDYAHANPWHAVGIAAALAGAAGLVAGLLIARR
jgi:ElaB/YqjD/DUF883 family membrane-anchored ribosome-binding protein